MKDGRKQVSSKTISKVILEDSKASPRAPFLSEIENNIRESMRLTIITWFLRVVVTGLEPAT